MLAPVGLAAHPVDESEQLSARVSFADLNLSSPAGRASFDRRIGYAIDALCGQVPTANLDAAAPVEKCRAAAQASASSQRQLAVAAAQQRSTIQIAARDR
jgi:UrcA family protein